MLFGTDGNAIHGGGDCELTTESLSLIMEMAIMENLSPEEIESLVENVSEVNNLVRSEIVEEKTIVRLDKKAKMSKAIKMAEFDIAREKNDKLFRKLLTVWRMERELEEAIHKKYNQQAKARARKAMTHKKVVSSPNAAVKKAANGLKGALNPEVKQKGTKKPVKPMAIGNVPLARLK